MHGASFVCMTFLHYFFALQVIVQTTFLMFAIGMYPAPQWSTRMKIALDAARGIAFLHAAERPLIYRDLKTSNILLDEVPSLCSL